MFDARGHNVNGERDRTSGMPADRRRFTAVALALALTVFAAACAGDVGQYRDAAVRAGEDGSVLDATEDLTPLEGLEGGLESGSSPAEPQVAPTPDRPQPAAAQRTGASAGAGTEAPTDAPSPQTEAPTDAPAGAKEVGVTPSQVTVGVFYGKSGPAATLLRNVEPAIQAAFNEVNEAGGVHGRKLVLKSYDDGSGDASIITANHRRARDEVFAYISTGHIPNDILAPLAEQDRVPAFLGNITGRLAETLRYSFAGWTYWSTQARALPSFIIKRLDGREKKIGVVFESTGSAAIDAKNIFKREASRAGLNVAFEQPIERNQASCSNAVTNMQSRGIELIVLMNGPLGAICMLRDARVVQYKPTWTGLGSGIGLNVTATGGLADGISIPGAWTTLETPAGVHFQATMRKHNPDSDAHSDDIAMLHYAMAVLYIEALERAGPNLTREQLVATMETKMRGFDSGYLSPVRFAPGDRSGPATVNVISCCTNGQWKTVDREWRESF